MRGVTHNAHDRAVLVGFQPALPMRGVTRDTAPSDDALSISTRTPHAGSDIDACDTADDRQ